MDSTKQHQRVGQNHLIAALASYAKEVLPLMAIQCGKLHVREPHVVDCARLWTASPHIYYAVNLR